MAMVWILFGTLVVAGAFFLVSFAQVLGIESRLRKLVIETEGRLSLVYNVKLVPPGHAPPAEARRKPAAEEDDSPGETDEESPE